MSRSVSLLTRPFASVARLAKSRAKNGTKSRTTGSFGREIRMTTPDGSVHLRGGMFYFWNRIGKKEVRSSVPISRAVGTKKILFARLDDLRARATQRVQELQARGHKDQQLYDPTETSVRGIHAFFLILGEPEAYGLPPNPQVPTIYLKSAWTAAFATAIASIIAI